MPRRSGKAGRPGSLEEARELVALVGSLSEAGDALTPEAVSAGLGVSLERAERLIELVLTATIGDDARLPLVEEGGGVTLLLSEGVRGRRLRLTRSETVALVAALHELGVDEVDPLLGRLRSSLDEGALDPRLVRDALTAGAAAGAATELGTCAAALAQGRELSFLYRKAGAAVGERRQVRPVGLRHEDSAWYLDAHDVARDDERTFRVDRMSETRLLGRSEPLPTRCHERAREVELLFSDARYLRLLPWHRLRVEEADEQGRIRAHTPYYGGDWLPRMVAACAGTVTTSDPEVSARAVSYAASWEDGP